MRQEISMTTLNGFVYSLAISPIDSSKFQYVLKLKSERKTFKESLFTHKPRYNCNICWRRNYQSDQSEAKQHRWTC